MSCFCFLVGTAGHEFLPGEHAIIRKNLSVSAEIFFFYEIELRYLLLVAKESDLSSN
jgi:hypothetical protein